MTGPPVTGPPVGEVLGCHQYCQQAGGYGGGGTQKHYMEILTPAEVEVDDNKVPVPLECLLPTPCKGAIIIIKDIVKDTDPWIELGRSDLSVAAGGQRMIDVEISPAGDRELALGGGAVPADVIADYGDPECPADGACNVDKPVVLSAR